MAKSACCAVAARGHRQVLPAQALRLQSVSARPALGAVASTAANCYRTSASSGLPVGLHLGLAGALTAAAGRCRPHVAAAAPTRRLWVPSARTVHTAVRRRNAPSAAAGPAAGLDEAAFALPPMSADGGSQEEFEEYWACNRSPKRLAGGWVERRSHPQVNIEPYWYNEDTGEIVWRHPDAVEEEGSVGSDGLEELQGDGPEWEMSIQELKEALANGERTNLGLRTEELCKRAVAEYERFEPRVLSWHDFQYLTFWFFGGMRRKESTPRGRSFFKGGTSPDLFAHGAFFQGAAAIMLPRLHRMHPINLTYFIWTFTRAGIVRRDLMEKVGNHLCEGLLPTMDRCSLGTMVWNFTKQGVHHDRLFAAAARELSRPNRTRSLAARNFQNVMIAYARRKFLDEDMYNALARGIPRLIDNHDPNLPKNERHVLFSYTCKDGSEVLADSFRINNLTVILKEFLKVRVKGPAMDKCIASMADYVHRSEEVTGRLMREDGDVAEFLCTLARAAASGLWAADRLLSSEGPFDVARLLEEMPQQKADQFQRTLREANITI